MHLLVICTVDINLLVGWGIKLGGLLCGFSMRIAPSPSLIHYITEQIYIKSSNSCRLESQQLKVMLILRKTIDTILEIRNLIKTAKVKGKWIPAQVGILGNMLISYNKKRCHN